MAAILTSLDAWQRRHPAVAFPVAVVRKFVDDRASNLAALVTYYAFFSVFPLVLVYQGWTYYVFRRRLQLGPSGPLVPGQPSSPVHRAAPVAGH